MPRTKEEKKKIIKGLEEKVKKQEAMVFVNFKGLKMDDFTELRNELSKSDSELVVSKKSLLKNAFKNSGLDIDTDQLKEEIAVIFGYSDSTTPTKIAYDFSKKNANLKMAGGFTEGVMRSQEEIVALAKLPSRDELIGTLLRTIQAPISGLANILQGNIRDFLYVLSRIK